MIRPNDDHLQEREGEREIVLANERQCSESAPGALVAKGNSSGVRLEDLRSCARVHSPSQFALANDSIHLCASIIYGTVTPQSRHLDRRRRQWCEVGSMLRALLRLLCIFFSRTGGIVFAWVAFDKASPPRDALAPLAAAKGRPLDQGMMPMGPQSVPAPSPIAFNLWRLAFGTADSVQWSGVQPAGNFPCESLLVGGRFVRANLSIHRFVYFICRILDRCIHSFSFHLPIYFSPVSGFLCFLSWLALFVPLLVYIFCSLFLPLFDCPLSCLTIEYNCPSVHSKKANLPFTTLQMLRISLSSADGFANEWPVSTSAPLAPLIWRHLLFGLTSVATAACLALWHANSLIYSPSTTKYTSTFAFSLFLLKCSNTFSLVSFSGNKEPIWLLSRWLTSGIVMHFCSLSKFGNRLPNLLLVRVML